MCRQACLAAAAGLAAVLCTAAGSAQAPALISALPRHAPAPADNPTTPEKVALGRLLFWDPVLSGTRDVACATCHHPDFGYADSLDMSIGVTGVGVGSNRRFQGETSIPLVKRNSQTLINVAFNGIRQDGAVNPSAAPMFWDLRVQGLEAQALEPIQAHEEMRGDVYTKAQAVARVVARLAAIAEYRRLFRKAFDDVTPITAGNLGKALASFQRSLIAANAPFDRYMRGETDAMTAVQVSGMDRFQRIGCANCHSGPMFSDYTVHVLGVPDNPKLPESDSGVNGTYGFRTPSLRNLASTAPYMHSGVLRTLNDVVRFYNAVGGRRGRFGTQNPNVSREQRDPLLQQLNLRGGVREVIEFLTALNDDRVERTIPDKVPSGLPPGGPVQ